MLGLRTPNRTDEQCSSFYDFPLSCLQSGTSTAAVPTHSPVLFFCAATVHKSLTSRPPRSRSSSSLRVDSCTGFLADRCVLAHSFQRILPHPLHPTLEHRPRRPFAFVLGMHPQGCEQECLAPFLDYACDLRLSNSPEYCFMSLYNQAIMTMLLRERQESFFLSSSAFVLRSTLR